MPLEAQRGLYRYSSALSLISVLNGVGGQRHTPAATSPGKRRGTDCTGGWVGSRAGMETRKSSCPHRGPNP